MNRPRGSVITAVAAVCALIVSVLVTAPATAHPRAVAQATPTKATSKVKKASTKKAATTKASKKKSKKPTTKKATTKKRPSTTRPSTTAAPAETVVNPLPDPGVTTTVLPGVTPPTLAPTVPVETSTTTTTRRGPTTTLAPAPFPAPANPPTRAVAATLDPYRGLGMWIDRFDWTARWSGKPIPPVNASTMDVLANAGVQTIYIQAAHWSSLNAQGGDVLEPERLIPIIDRAHQLGMYVVVWYLPTWQDVNTDLRKTVAIANLDVDGVNIDIEDYEVVKDHPERTRRLVAYSAALRGLLPGRAITNNIYAVNWLDGAPDFWPQQTGPQTGTPKTNIQWWRGPFPYAQLAPHYDLWMIQNYWTDRAVTSGWRDGYRYSVDNINRLRAALGRNDVPIQLIGGVGGSKMTLNDFSGWLQASRETGSVGVSFYDWQVFNKGWMPYLWQFRWTPPGAAPDPRFPPTPAPPYVAVPQPPPPPPTVPAVTTLPTVLVPTVSVPPPPPA
jgi:hypothetical protein